ncbi:MAG: peptidoglycan DD-metalloendopeptidase family protein [Bacteroidaceae bacterium]|nr:peptidoglycan DD-metalloendopeptidase family protein [Bacteroidaceae bacterium]
MKKLFKSFLFTIGLQIFATPIVFAQDLLAAQSPLDRQMELVDSIALRDMLLNEENMFPADGLYESWKNDKVRFNAELPDSFRVDLRGFVMPTTNTKITDVFGYRRRRGRVHNGIDVKVQKGDTIYSAFDGKVRITAYQRRGYGHYIVIRHNNGLETVYAHLSKKFVVEDQNVKAGTPIGLGGNTGRSTGAHLHFETLLAGKNINPALIFDFERQDVTGDFYTYRKGVYQEIDKKTGKIIESAEPLYHKVRKGESLSVIARKCGVSVNTLYKLNKMNSRSVIRPGQRIRYR